MGCTSPLSRPLFAAEQSVAQVVGAVESKLDSLQLERELLADPHGLSATLSSNASTAQWPKVLLIPRPLFPPRPPVSCPGCVSVIETHSL